MRKKILAICLSALMITSLCSCAMFEKRDIFEQTKEAANSQYVQYKTNMDIHIEPIEKVDEDKVDIVTDENVYIPMEEHEEIKPYDLKENVVFTVDNLQKKVKFEGIGTHDNKEMNLPTFYCDKEALNIDFSPIFAAIIKNEEAASNFSEKFGGFYKITKETIMELADEMGEEELLTASSGDLIKTMQYVKELNDFVEPKLHQMLLNEQIITKKDETGKTKISITPTEVIKITDFLLNLEDGNGKLFTDVVIEKLTQEGSIFKDTLSDEDTLKDINYEINEWKEYTEDEKMKDVTNNGECDYTINIYLYKNESKDICIDTEIDYKDSDHKTSIKTNTVIYILKELELNVPTEVKDFNKKTIESIMMEIMSQSIGTFEPAEGMNE